MPSGPSPFLDPYKRDKVKFKQHKYGPGSAKPAAPFIEGTGRPLPEDVESYAPFGMPLKSVDQLQQEKEEKKQVLPFSP